MSEPIHPDHHLWKNGRLWWVAYTVHLPGWKKARLRQSLETEDVVVARARRDRLFRLWDESGRGTLSLRYQPPRPSPSEDASRCA